MNREKPYKVLIVEDNPNCANPIRERLEREDKYEVLGVTGSAHEAYKLTKTGLPDVVITDLQLEEGSGFSLIQRLRNPDENLPIKPYILVITSFTAESTMQKLGNGFADFAFAKKDGLFDPDQVLEHLTLFEDLFYRNRKPTQAPIDSTLEKTERIRARIENELSEYYIVHGSKSRTYLAELLYQAAILPRTKELELNVIYNEMGQQFQNNPHNIDMAIRRAISSAFTKTARDDLERVYTPYVNISSGAPGTKEFVAYTIEKFRKERILWPEE